jgi:transcriptional regulator with PAS, ATPase and Fis domain
MQIMKNKSEYLADLFIGQSSNFSDVIQRIKKIAEFPVPVFVYGETGTGKELCAQAIHKLSSRSNKPFVAINCGSIPDTLIENELFGHVKGAYTDAQSTNGGVIAHANGGTLFLDEIDTLSPKGQVSLLRFIQEKEYKPLGTDQSFHSDVRIISATNADIQSKINSGEFRQDLYFRLNIMDVHLPPLRARGRDVELLANYFIHKHCNVHHIPEKTIHPDAIEKLHQYPWPGNVRELEHALLKEILLAETTTLYLNNIESQHYKQQHDLPQMKAIFDLDFRDAKEKIVMNFEKDYLDNMMKKTAGNVTKAAELAGTERRTFGKLLKKHGLVRGYYASFVC